MPISSKYPEFAEFQLLYPRRSGSQRWGQAKIHYERRRADGHSHEVIMQGLQRYTDWVNATHKVGTEMVMQAATFLGTNLAFLEEWRVDKPMSDFERTKQRMKEASRVVSDQRAGPGEGGEDLEQPARFLR